MRNTHTACTPGPHCTCARAGRRSWWQQARWGQSGPAACSPWCTSTGPQWLDTSSPCPLTNVGTADGVGQGGVGWCRTVRFRRVKASQPAGGVEHQGRAPAASCLQRKVHRLCAGSQAPCRPAADNMQTTCKCRPMHPPAPDLESQNRVCGPVGSTGACRGSRKQARIVCVAYFCNWFPRAVASGGLLSMCVSPGLVGAQIGHPATQPAALPTWAASFLRTSSGRLLLRCGCIPAAFCGRCCCFCGLLCCTAGRRCATVGSTIRT